MKRSSAMFHRYVCSCHVVSSWNINPPTPHPGTLTPTERIGRASKPSASNGRFPASRRACHTSPGYGMLRRVVDAAGHGCNMVNIWVCGMPKNCGCPKKASLIGNMMLNHRYQITTKLVQQWLEIVKTYTDILEVDACDTVAHDGCRLARDSGTNKSEFGWQKL